MPGWWVRRWAAVPALASAVVGEPRQEEQLIKACQWPGRELTVRDGTMVVRVTAAGLLFSSFSRATGGFALSLLGAHELSRENTTPSTG